MKLCPKCNCKIEDDDMTFCPECGETLEVNSVERQSLYCTKCGAKLSGGVKFCPECGKEISEASSFRTIVIKQNDWEFSDIKQDFVSIEESKDAIPIVLNITDKYIISSCMDNDEIKVLCKLPNVVFYTDVNTCYYGTLPSDVDERTAVKVKDIISLLITRSSVELNFDNETIRLPAFKMLEGLLEKIISDTKSCLKADFYVEILTIAFPDYDTFRIIRAIMREIKVKVERFVHENDAYLFSFKLKETECCISAIVNKLSGYYITSCTEIEDGVYECKFINFSKHIDIRNFCYDDSNYCMEVRKLFLANFDNMSKDVFEGFKMLCPNADVEILNETSLLHGSYVQFLILMGKVGNVLPLFVCPSSFQIRTDVDGIQTVFPDNVTIPSKKSLCFKTSDGSADFLQDEKVLLKHFILPKEKVYECTVDCDSNYGISIEIKDLKSSDVIVSEFI